MSLKYVRKEEVAWQTDNGKSNAGLVYFVAFSKASGSCTCSGAFSAKPFSSALSAFSRCL